MLKVSFVVYCKTDYLEKSVFICELVASVYVLIKFTYPSNYRLFQVQDSSR